MYPNLRKHVSLSVRNFNFSYRIAKTSEKKVARSVHNPRDFKRENCVFKPTGAFEINFNFKYAAKLQGQKGFLPVTWSKNRFCSKQAR